MPGRAYSKLSALMIALGGKGMFCWNFGNKHISESKIHSLAAVIEAPEMKDKIR